VTFIVVFIHGPAAAGKHTIGRLVSEHLGLPLFHNHLAVDLASTLFEFGTPAFVRLRAEIWLASFRAAADEARSFVFTFNPERTVDPALIGELSAIVASGGGRMGYVELRCSDAEIERRIDNASRHEFGKLTDPDVYRELKSAGHFEFPGLPEPLVSIDTEQVTPEAAARHIVRALEGVFG